MTEPDFAKKYFFPLFCPKRGQNGSKMGLLYFSEKSSLTFSVKWCQKMRLNVIKQLAKTACQNKLWFSRYGSKGGKVGGAVMVPGHKKFPNFFFAYFCELNNSEQEKEEKKF